MTSAFPFPRSFRSSSGGRQFSFRGSRARVRRSLGERGFTLLEILLAIAIIALIGTVLIGGSANLLRDQPASAEEVFQKVVQECRKKALKSEKEVRLEFRKDGDTKRFAIVDSAAPPADPNNLIALPDPNAGVLAEYPIPSATDVDVAFLGTQKGGSMILIGGVAVETTTLPHVTFYPDGTCTPFRAQFSRSGSNHAIAIDPWTCAEMLTPIDPNAPPTS